MRSAALHAKRCKKTGRAPQRSGYRRCLALRDRRIASRRESVAAAAAAAAATPYCRPRRVNPSLPAEREDGR